jgi:hypothetical protein
MKTLVNNPGVCMDHQDGRCATDAETVWVESRVGCTTSATVGGTFAAPYCLAQLGIDAARSSSAKRLVLMRGSLTPGWQASPPAGVQLSVVGQGGATIVPSSSGSGIGIDVTGGDVYIRNVTIRGVTTPGGETGTGIVARSGSVLRLSSVRAEDNKGGGILLDGAAFDIRNTRADRNGAAQFGPLTVWGGILVNNPPATGPARLEKVSVVGNKAAGLACSQAVSGSGVSAIGNASFEITTTCGIANCGAMTNTCGSDLPQ